MLSEMIFSSYTSPNGLRMANPLLVNRQLQEMRTVMERMRQFRFQEEQTVNHLYELAASINGSGRKAVAAKKKVDELRAVSRRQQAVHESSNPALVQKLAKISRNS